MRERPVHIDVQLLGEIVHLLTRNVAAKTGEKRHELATGHVLVEPQFAGQVCGAFAGLDSLSPAIEPGDLRVALCGPEESKQKPQSSGLAGTVGPEEAEHFTGGKRKVERIEGAERTVIFGEVLGDEQRRGQECSPRRP